MPTIKDVAKKAGVSVMTVSRVINNNGYVNEETRKKVLLAIDELNYRPNLVAKSLITGRTNTIAHIMVNIANLFHPKVIKGVEDAGYQNNYSVVVCDADSKDKEIEYISNLSDRFVDGMIFHHLNITEAQIKELTEKNIKCVLIDNEQIVDGCINVVTDDVYGGYLAGRHLLEKGHRRIAIIHGSLEYNIDKATKEYEETFQFSIWNKRLEGFVKALEEYDLSLDKNYMFEGEGTTAKSINSGYSAMEQILSLKEKPTAIYAQNDHMAIGAINAAIEAGYSVPEDFSIIGHDGLDIDELIIPKLTTIEQPRYEMGFKAAQSLIELIEGKTSSHIIDFKT